MNYSDCEGDINDAIDNPKYYKNISGIKSLFCMGYESPEILMNYLFYTKKPLNEKIVDFLRDMGAPFGRSRSVLSTYCKNPTANAMSIRMLVEHGATFACNTPSRNALHVYVQYHDVLDPNIIEYLLSIGLDINQTCEHGHTALMLVQDPIDPYEKNVSAEETDGSIDLFSIRACTNTKLLLENHANAKLTDKQGRTFVHYLMKKLNGMAVGLPKMVSILHEFSVDLNTKDNDGKTPADLIDNISQDDKRKLESFGFEFSD